MHRLAAGWTLSEVHHGVHRQEAKRGICAGEQDRDYRKLRVLRLEVESQINFPELPAS
ncbi:MAG: hypothetical protein OEV40_18935 [Acidimicrobiia bacterium]|nr:hypothetical protein [Acidimicrobiia bacterium]